MDRYDIVVNNSPWSSWDELKDRSVYRIVRAFHSFCDLDESKAIDKVLDILGYSYIDDFYDAFSLDEEISSFKNLLSVCEENNILDGISPQVVFIVKNRNNIIFRAKKGQRFVDPFDRLSDEALFAAMTDSYDRSYNYHIDDATADTLRDILNWDYDSIKKWAHNVIRKAPLRDASGVTDEGFNLIEEDLMELDYTLDHISDTDEHLTFQNIIDFMKDPYSFCSLYDVQKIRDFYFISAETRYLMSLLYEKPISKLLEKCHTWDDVKAATGGLVWQYDNCDCSVIFFLRINGLIELGEEKAKELGPFDLSNGTRYEFNN